MNELTKSDLQKKITFWGHGIWISTLLILLPPMIGLMTTVVGMKNAFENMGNSGIGDPAALSGHISSVLQATLWGAIFSSLGIVFLVLSIVKFLQHRSSLGRLANS